MVWQCIPWFLLSLMVVMVTPTVADDRAILIGIGHYQNGIQPLQGPEHDVRNMKRLVTEQLGFEPTQIITLLHGQATRAAILQQLLDLIADTKAGDRVLFYYSGHGFQTVDRDGDEPDALDETLVSIDTYIDAKGVIHNMVLDDELESVFGSLHDREVTIIIDSCHSGSATRGQALLGANMVKSLRFIDRPLPPESAVTRGHVGQPHSQTLVPSTPRRVVWSAVSSYQLALEDLTTQPRTGAFTNFFVEGLSERKADRNGDGRITYLEQWDYVQARSKAYCEWVNQREVNLCALGLTPTLEIERSRLQQPLYASASPSLTVDTAADLASAALTHHNDFQVTLELLKGKRVRQQFKRGEFITYRVTSQRAGHFHLLDARPNGDLVVIYPNMVCNQPMKPLQAGRAVKIPANAYAGCRFEVIEPIGTGRAIALVIEDPVDVTGILAKYRRSQTRDLDVVPRDVVGDFLAALAQKLRETWNGERHQRGVRWASAIIDYETQ